MKIKRRITVEDIKSLKDSQKENLNKLWRPEKYDIVMATVCTDVENDIWSDIEFTVGQIKMFSSGKCLLYDLRYLENLYQLDKSDENAEDVPFDAYISFNMNDCLPLLDMGQMIEILNFVNLNKYHFYMLAGDGKYGCELGNYNSILKSTILSDGYQKAEFIDLMWGIIKSIL